MPSANQWLNSYIKKGFKEQLLHAKDSLSSIVKGKKKKLPSAQYAELCLHTELCYANITSFLFQLRERIAKSCRTKQIYYYNHPPNQTASLFPLPTSLTVPPCR